jgi:hypothetical protein
MPKVFKFILHPWWFPRLSKVPMHALVLSKLSRVLECLLLPLEFPSLPWFLFMMLHLTPVWWRRLRLHWKCISKPCFSYRVQEWIIIWPKWPWLNWFPKLPWLLWWIKVLENLMSRRSAWHGIPGLNPYWNRLTLFPNWRLFSVTLHTSILARMSKLSSRLYSLRFWLSSLPSFWF